MIDGAPPTLTAAGAVAAAKYIARGCRARAHRAEVLAIRGVMSHTTPAPSCSAESDGGQHPKSFCTVCNVQCGNSTRYAQHISGRRHKQAALAAGAELQPEPQAQEDSLLAQDGPPTLREDLVAAPPRLTDAAVGAVVSALSPLIAPTRLQSLQAAAAQRCGGVHLAFENVVQNDNVATALRTAECAGIHHVHLIRGPQALSSKRGGSLKRVDNALSKGAERWLQLHYHRDTAAFVEAMRAAGFKMFGADADASATTIADCGFGQTPDLTHGSSSCDTGCVVIFGNERDGMSAELRAACGDLFFLPSVGLTQSYNVFVSAAMAVHHLQMRAVVRPDRSEAQQKVPDHHSQPPQSF